MTVAGGVIVAGFGMAIKTAKEFEQSMANTASVAGATAEELKTLSNYAREMGEQSVFSASEAADAMYYLASAGMNVDEIMGALEGTLALAAATQSDLAFTSEAVAATLSQFGLDAEEAGRVANVFAATISGSQATMDKLATSMSYVGPIANSMGLTLEETTGILGKLYDAGIDGSMAGTALRKAFTSLLSPTEDAITALEDLEVSLTDSSGEMKPFVDIIEELEEAGASTTQMIDIFGQRAGPAMMALISQGSDSIRELTEEITNTDKASEMAAMQIDTFEGAMKLLRSAFEELQITLVQDLMPALKGLIGDLAEGVKKVTAWMKANPELTETIVKWGAAIGALMLVLGPLLMALPGLVTLIAALTSPIGLVIIAAGALYLAFTNWDKLVEIVGNIKDKVIAKIEEWANAISKWWDNIVENTDNKWILVADAVFGAIGNMITWLTETIGNLITSIFGWWNKIESDTDSIWSKIKDVIVGFVQEFVDFITNILPALILDIIAWWKDIRTNTETIWEAIKTAIISIVQNIWDSITSILEPVVEFVSGLWNSIKGDTSTIWGSIESIISSAVSGIESVISGMISTIESAWATAQKIYNWIKEKLDAASSLIENAPTITTGGESVSDIIESVESTPPPSITEPVPGVGGVPWYQHGTPYVPRTELAMVHKGEEINPPGQRSYDQRKSYTSSINIMAGAIQIITPKFDESDAQELFTLIEQQAKMRNLEFAKAY